MLPPAHTTIVIFILETKPDNFDDNDNKFEYYDNDHDNDDDGDDDV